MTIFEFKDEITSLVFGKQADNSDNSPYTYEDVIDRLKDIVQTQSIQVPISECDVEEYFKPLVEEGTTFDWDFVSEDGTPINVLFYSQTHDD